MACTFNNIIRYYTFKKEQTKINDFLNINSCLKIYLCTTHYREGTLICASTYKIIINFKIHSLC